MNIQKIKKWKKNLKGLTSTAFEKQLLYASFDNLKEKKNKLRFNNFACAIRALADFILSSLSSDVNVKKCVWYQDDKIKKGRVTRNDKIRFAIQKGLPNDFVEKFYDVDENIDEIKEFFIIVNKFTHVTEATFDISKKDIADNVETIVNALSNFLNSIHDYPKELLKQLESNIDEVIIAHTLTESLDNVDELSTHHNVHDSQISNFKITSLTSNQIKIKIDGSIDVRQQYGSDGDFARGDGLEMYSSFPFKSLMNIDIAKNFSKSRYKITSFKVDTSSWDI